jgi:hypothetical protein
MGFKFPHVHPRVSADLIKPFVQPSACALRPGEADFPIVGDASRDIEVLLARAPARGRPPQKGRRIYQYNVGSRLWMHCMISGSLRRTSTSCTPSQPLPSSLRATPGTSPPGSTASEV